MLGHNVIAAIANHLISRGYAVFSQRDATGMATVLESDVIDDIPVPLPLSFK
jgi:hypothetical protein